MILLIMYCMLLVNSFKMNMKTTSRSLSVLKHNILKPFGNTFNVSVVNLPDVNNKRSNLHYLDMGDDKSLPPLVIIPGTSQTVNTFTPHIKNIARSRRLIIPEMRCQGRTELDSKYGTMDQLVLDFKNFMDALYLSDVHLCGFSFGGRVALAIASEYPSLVSKLSITGVPLVRPALGRLILDSWLNCILSGSMRDCAWSFLINGYSEKFIEQHHEKLSLYVDAIVQANDPAKLRDLLLMSHVKSDQDRYSIPNCAARIVCPTQVIGATHDRIAGMAPVRDLAQACRAREMVEMEGCGHLAPFEEPVKWRQLVMDFTAGKR